MNLIRCFSTFFFLTLVSVVSGQNTRLVEYTVDEGTWISLDVSPDGQAIVFELVGDIYVMPIQGGTAKAIVSGLAFQSQPRYSPDGKYIAYVSDEGGSENVWMAGTDGSSPKNLTKAVRPFMLSPEWSSDGREIYVTVVDGQGLRSGATTKGEGELWRYEVRTGQGTRIVANANGPGSPIISSPAPGPYGAHAASDGRSLHYTSVRPRSYGVRQGASSHVIKRDIASGTEERVWLDGSNAMKPLTSPDGKWLVYAAENRGLAGMKCYEMATGREFWLKDQMQRSELEGRASRDVLPNYDFSPDSKYVYAAFMGKIHRLEVATKEDVIIPFSAAVSIPVKERIHFPQRLEDGPVKARILEHLAVSDDGRAAISTFGRIYLVDLASGKSKRLTTASQPREFMPSWSPDGKWIAYVSWGAEGGHLWKVSTKGEAAPVRLSEQSAFWLDPSWSEDGSTLLALRAPLGSGRAVPEIPAAPELMRPPDTDIVRVPAQGGPYQVIARANNARFPHGVRGSDRIYLSSSEGLISLNAEGVDKKVHFTVPARVASPFLIPSLRIYKVNGNQKEIMSLSDGMLYKAAFPAQERTTLNLSDQNTYEVLSDQMPRTMAWSSSGKSHAWITGRTIHVSTGPGRAKATEVTIELPRESTKGTVVLRGARAITMKGDEIIGNADILVTNNRITAIGRQGQVAVPAGAIVMDLSGKTVVPGFIDVHAHWGIRSELWEPENPSTYSNLAFGITTVRDPQGSPDIFGYADWASTGMIPSPRIFSTGPSINENQNIQSLEEAMRLVRIYRENYGTTQMKLYLPGTRQQRQWLGEACRALGVMPTAEAGGDSKEVITHFLDGYNGNEHTLSAQPMYQDLVQLFARTGITYTPTLLVAFGAALPIYRVLAEERPFDDPKIKNFFPEGQIFLSSGKRLLWFTDEDMNYRDAGAGANAILKAGGRVALGGHGEMQGLSNHWEMRLMSEGSMSLHDVLKVSTIMGAETLGMDKDLGSLEPGKLADLVVLDKDPLENIRNTTSIRYVMKNGRLYEGATLDEVWPEKIRLPLPWWKVE